MNRKGAVRLGFAGDLMLGGEAVRYARTHGLDWAYPFQALLPTLAELDLLFVNLEGPVFEGNSAAMRKALLLSNHPGVVRVLKLPGICVCSLANNHSFDYGAESLFKTQRYLEQNGIRHIGAGRMAAEANREVVLERAGWRIGCLAFAGTGVGLRPVMARDDRAGCASLQDEVAAIRAVRRLRKHVDLVVVMLHWGLEFHEYPSATQVRLARALVDAGAHFIAGHHPHAVQAVESYKGAVIAYSLGHLFMPPFRLSLPAAAADGRRRTNQRREKSTSPTQQSLGETDGPVFYPRAATREFVLIRVAIPAEFPSSPGSVEAVAGGLDAHFRLRPYNRIALQTFRGRLDNLGCPLRNGGYAGFWRHYHSWREREVAAWRQWPTAEENFV